MQLSIFFLVAVIFIASFFLRSFFERKIPQIKPKAFIFGITCLLAFISILAINLIIYFTPQWTDGTRIAWIGMRSFSKTLTIGGSQETASVGWANGNFSPKLTAELKNNTVDLQITGNDGFVREEKTKKYLNGEIIKSGEIKQQSGYGFRLSGVIWSYLEILDSQNQIIVEVPLPFSRRKDRVYSLISLVEKESDRFSPVNLDKFNTFEAFRRWSQNIRILLTAEGEVRYLAYETDGKPTAPAPSVPCESPCKISVLWGNSKITAILDKEPKGENLMIQYLPPFRNLSPPPPAEAKGKLAITGQPQPDDYAFTLPLGKKGLYRKENEIWREEIGIEFKPKKEDSNTPPEFSFVNGGKQDLLEDIEGQTSVVVANAKEMSFMLALITDLPSLTFILFLSLLALVGLFVGLFVLMNSGVSTDNYWGISGLVLIVWMFLSIRFLLALRYALDPTYLDDLAVSGVTWALVGLAVIPLFLLFLGRLFADKYQFVKTSDEKIVKGQKSARNTALALLVILFILGSLEFWLAPKLWGNLPMNFVPKMSWSGLFGTFLIFIYLAGYVWLSNIIWSNPLENKWAQISQLWKDKKWIELLTVLVFHLPMQIWELPKLISEKSVNIWTKLLKVHKKELEGQKIEYQIKIWQFWKYPVTWAGFALCLVGIYLIFNFSRRFVFGDELLFTHTIVPLVFCWTPILFWLSSKKIDFQKYLPNIAPRKSAFLWKLCICLALVTIFLPIFFIPVIISDAGSMYAYTALFLSLSFILLKRSGRTRVFGAVVSIIFGVTLLVSIFVYYNTLSLAGYLPGELGARMLVFKEGHKTQHLFLVAGAGDEESSLGLNLINLQNVYEHLWENQAIAHESGWLGAGLGNAPVRASQVRQDTIQFDSVYSFYVVGDYGLVGGIFLLLLYLSPLLIVFFAGRNLFDTGYAVAFIVVSTFCLEALTHSAMNLGFLPFTGRDLPLLAVNSFKGDWLRWTILFALAINAMFWRYKEKDTASDENELNLDETDVLEGGGATPVSESSATGWKAILQNNLRSLINPSSTRKKVFCLIAFPALLLVCVFWTNWKIIGNKDLETAFTWDVMLRDAQWAIDNGCVALDEKSQKLDFVETKCKTLDKGNLDKQFIGQQINRFNSMTSQEKFGDGAADWILKELGAVDSQAKYDALMKKISLQPLPVKRREPNLFSLETFYDDEGEEYLKVVPNPEMNVRVSFRERKQQDIPKIGLSEGKTLIGAAWVKGKWKPAVNPDPNLLSWTDWVAEALSLEGKRLSSKGEKVNTIYKDLTLDQKLHQSALNFVAEKGRGIQTSLLSKAGRKSSTSWQNKLPPRVALTVMQLSNGNDNGAVLALGSFPRATSGSTWKTLETGEVLPPLAVLEKVFPKQLKSLYAGDRNFDNTILMGSSTKPIFAASALAVHPSLSKDLTVSGNKGPDDKVFGIKIVNDSKFYWIVSGSKKNPVNFEQFLTESNNRYQVALGFLSVAEKEGGEIVSQKKAGTLEFLKGQPFAPDFLSNISFSADPDRSQKIENLDQTLFAKKLRSMFGVNIFYTNEPDGKEDYTNYMYSFWTKNEDDDVLKKFDEQDTPTPDKVRRSSFLPAILPARANLRLNQIQSPRDYVSLLLGGKENKWSNVQSAAAFGSSVTGKRILPHIVKNSAAPTFYGREDFTDISKSLRSGLNNVIFADNGTANGKFNETKALILLKDLESKGYKVFAKTGTLAAESDLSAGNQQKNELTTRIILAIVKFGGDGKNETIERGLVFSMVAERAPIRTSTEWLGYFLTKNEDDIRRLLSPPPTPKAK